MNRRLFLQSCAACMGGAALSTLLQGCKSTGYVAGQLTDNGVAVPLKDFILNNGAYRSYLIIRQEVLQYPICVYRLGDQHFTALWMQCSHQGAELQASGDRLTCPAHGSEFNNLGTAVEGPATASLRSFPVRAEGDHLFIDLRKQL